MADNRVVRVPLIADGIDEAIAELERYEKSLKQKATQIVQRLAERGMETARLRFSNAQYDGSNDVSVSMENRGEMTRAVIAVGATTLFIEFGTGVRYPDDHPEAAKHGMVRGGYGHHLGRNPNGWRYKGNPGTNGERIQTGRHAGEVRTHGNPANKCMYGSIRELEETFRDTVREVFRS